jgi:hypothetical protein
VELATIQLDTATSKMAKEQGHHHCANDQRGKNADDHLGRPPSSVDLPAIVR